ncbi:phosphatidylglycerophosphatase A-like protein [Natrinema sp. J7-2]|nr:phosphatidylglycerophosphatase A-like protein [Natrinema sp. J7-2]
MLVFVVLEIPVSVMYLFLVCTALTFLIACLSFGDWAQDRWESDDPQAVVADETIGQTLPLFWLPWHGSGTEESLLWTGFLVMIAVSAFRAFDVSKPPPLRALERMPGGWGIISDDIGAGVYAALTTGLVIRVVQPTDVDTVVAHLLRVL